jgi:hypothetical protein
MMDPTKKIKRPKDGANTTVKIPKSLSVLLDLHEKKLFSLTAWATIIFGGIIITFHFLYNRNPGNV